MGTGIDTQCRGVFQVTGEYHLMTENWLWLENMDCFGLQRLMLDQAMIIAGPSL
ncbi:MAG: hypothetical protein LUH22_03215 [Bacteroides sp.]|nr:hypothetical protein [Bacteroides sp.]